MTTGLIALCPGPLRAQEAPQPSGFEVNRYQPTPAGEWSFWVDHPFYSSTRRLAAGLTIDYANKPLGSARIDADGTLAAGTPVISHLLTGHFDLAVSFADRVTLNASLPVTFLASGTEQPIGGLLPPAPGLNDPRLGGMVRLFGQPDESPLSLNLGLQLWIPLQSVGGTGANTRNDAGVRVLPKLVLAGYGHKVRWSFSGGFLYRGEAQLAPGEVVGNTAGSELQLGASLQYADKEHGVAIGPEAVLATLLVPNRAFEIPNTSLEVLLGAHFNIANQVQLALAGGLGVLGQAGTPEARFLARLAYAPIKVPPKDRDGDGIVDEVDACIGEPGVRTSDPLTSGCPPDSDQDGILDKDDQCPQVAMGARPDPQRSGCPLQDRDNDGIADSEDACPDVAPGERPDPQRSGCPLLDRDDDGVSDGEDPCPDAAPGAHPDPQRKGCPADDRDHDGVFDPDDQCPEVVPGPKADPQRAGCPAPDRDGDSVVDHEDACPDQAGAPSSDPKKSGCPGLVEVKQGRVAIKEQVFFDTKKDTIQKKSFPLLLAVADALKASPQLKKVEVQGHTDNVGPPASNLGLSDRRANSVMRFLIANGVAAERLAAKGYGQTRPIQDNKTVAGRAVNRRVEFVIVDPPQPVSAAPPAPPAPPAASPKGGPPPKLPSKLPAPGATPAKPTGAVGKAKAPIGRPKPAGPARPQPPK
ncbi:MAG: OmpA family protein [Polyangia bacterium]